MSSIFVFIQALVDLVTNLINIEIAILCELFLKITSNLLKILILQIQGCIFFLKI